MDEQYIAPLENLIQKIRLLPAVGRKTAIKYAMRILELPPDNADAFLFAIQNAREKIHRCSKCFNMTEGELCSICSDPRRDASTICVVEDIRSLMAVERAKGYRGVYHILDGTISPIDGRGPENIHLLPLVERVEKEKTKEVIIATGMGVDGETTSMYISRMLANLPVKITRLAYGLPAGGELEFADEITLLKSIEGRQEIIIS